MTSTEAPPPTGDELPPPSQESKLKATCHCGRVTVELPSKPEKLNECRCTVCYKYGAIWGYFQRDTVTVTAAEGASIVPYVRTDSDGDISFNRCSHCGCMTNWWGVGQYSGPKERMGVNCRQLPEKEIEGIPRKVSYC